jgi:uncharacterized membrane protein
VRLGFDCASSAAWGDAAGADKFIAENADDAEGALSLRPLRSLAVNTLDACGDSPFRKASERMSDVQKPSLLARRWRILLGAAVMAAVIAAARQLHLLPGLAGLIGWNAGSVVYLATTLWMLWRDDEATVRRRAAYEDEGSSVTQIIILSAVVASLGATVLALREGKGAHDVAAPSWAWLFSVSTLILGWAIVQTVFALTYAHRYFGDGDRDGADDKGVEFPGEPPKTYHDFIYMAVCIGASAQVSDFDITSSRLRRLVTLHSLLAFFFNTMILALGINIIASVISA